MAEEKTERVLQAELQQKAKAVREEDVQRVADRAEEFQQKVGKVPGKLELFVRQVKLLFEVIRAYADGSYREIPYASIAMAVAALLYFLSPVDLIPDVIPVIGYVDDAIVVRLAFLAIQEDLRTYCAAKGYEASQYFG